MPKSSESFRQVKRSIAKNYWHYVILGGGRSKQDFIEWAVKNWADAVSEYTEEMIYGFFGTMWENVKDFVDKEASNDFLTKQTDLDLFVYSDQGKKIPLDPVLTYINPQGQHEKIPAVLGQLWHLKSQHEILTTNIERNQKRSHDVLTMYYKLVDVMGGDTDANIADALAKLQQKGHDQEANK